MSDARSCPSSQVNPPARHEVNAKEGTRRRFACSGALDDVPNLALVGGFSEPLLRLYGTPYLDLLFNPGREHLPDLLVNCGERRHFQAIAQGEEADLGLDTQLLAQATHVLEILFSEARLGPLR